MSETQTKTADPVRVLPPEAPVNNLPARVVRPLPDGEVPILIPPPTPKLCAALAAAQKKCKAAPKDAENTFHHFKYASAEAIIQEAKEALADSGIAPLAFPPHMVTRGNGPTCYFFLERDVRLMHVSGEEITMACEWPVIPDKGRPLDKAFASADTTSLAYFYRDLLMMPRSDPADEMAGRKDEPAKPQQQKSAPKPEAPKEPPLTIEEQAAVQPFVDWLSRMPDIAGVNFGLKDLMQLEGRAKGKAWELIRAYCNKYGWTWDKANKIWHEKQEEMPS